jgi:transposase InsO family protein
VFASEHIEIIRTPFQAPQANAVAERFVRTVRRECLDWLLILNEAHLKRVLAEFMEHYNGHRPHRALSLTPPDGPGGLSRTGGALGVQRWDRLGGVIHEYFSAA